MRNLMIGACALAMGSMSAHAAELATDQQKMSYFLGFQVGQQFKQDGIDLDAKAFLQAIEDAKSGAVPKLTPEEMQATVQRFQKAKMAETQQAAAENQKIGEDYLAANKGKPGVKTTASGLQYKVITAGEGKQPTATSTVSVHYRGTLIDGTEFDSSYKRGQPAEFPVNGVIPGWTEALQLMKEGAKWELYIPSGLAYGPRGAGGSIGPNATLKFEVELLEVK